MKLINFNITLNDFWMDEDSGDLEMELKNHITGEVSRKIFDSIKEKTKTEYIKQVGDSIRKVLDEKIKKCVDDLIKKGTIMHYGTEEKIEDYIKNKFDDSSQSRWSPQAQIKILAEDFTKELKVRYDLAFATQIVTKLAEKGLLKDDKLKKLLELA